MKSRATIVIQVSVLYVLTIVGIAFLQAFFLQITAFLDDPSLMLFGFALLEFFVVVILVLYGLTRCGLDRSVLGLRLPRVSLVFLWGIVFGSVLYLVSSYLHEVSLDLLQVNDVTHPYLEKLSTEAGLLNMFPILLVIIILGPVSEEMLFRGFFQNALRSGSLLWLKLIILNLCFAAMHIHPVDYLPAFVSGMSLSVLYESYRSIVLVAVAHCIVNLLATISYAAY